jgi:hypothetical protein
VKTFGLNVARSTNLQPDPEHVLVAVDVEPDDEVGDLVGHQPGVAHIDSAAVDDQDWINLPLIDRARVAGIKDA